MAEVLRAAPTSVGQSKEERISHRSDEEKIRFEASYRYLTERPSLLKSLVRQCGVTLIDLPAASELIVAAHGPTRATVEQALSAVVAFVKLHMSGAKEYVLLVGVDKHAWAKEEAQKLSKDQSMTAIACRPRETALLFPVFLAARGGHAEAKLQAAVARLCPEQRSRTPVLQIDDGSSRITREVVGLPAPPPREPALGKLEPVALEWEAGSGALKVHPLQPLTQTLKEINESGEVTGAGDVCVTPLNQGNVSLSGNGAAAVWAVGNGKSAYATRVGTPPTPSSTSGSKLSSVLSTAAVGPGGWAATGGHRPNGMGLPSANMVAQIGMGPGAWGWSGTGGANMMNGGMVPAGPTGAGVVVRGVPTAAMFFAGAPQLQRSVLVLEQVFNLTPVNPMCGDDMFAQLSLAAYGRPDEIGRVRMALKQTLEYDQDLIGAVTEYAKGFGLQAQDYLNALLTDVNLGGGQLELQAAARMQNARVTLYDGETQQYYEFTPGSTVAPSAEIQLLHYQSRFWLLGPAVDPAPMDVEAMESMGSMDDL